MKEVKNKGKNAYKALVNKLMKQTEGEKPEEEEGFNFESILANVQDKNNRSSRKPIGKTLANLPALARDPSWGRRKKLFLVSSWLFLRCISKKKEHMILSRWGVATKNSLRILKICWRNRAVTWIRSWWWGFWVLPSLICWRPDRKEGNKQA